MKINSKELDEMTKKQVKDIYLKASFGEIDEDELVRIREALYELTPLCHFTKDDYSSLIETLDKLSDEALKSIEGGAFTRYYRRGLRNDAGMPEDFEQCDSLVNAIYTDYKGVNSFAHFMLMGEYMLDLYRYTDFADETIVKYLELLNPELCNLLAETRKAELEGIYDKLKPMQMSTRLAYVGILQQLLTTYMMYADEYKDGYSVPSTILSFMVDNFSEEQIQKLGMGMRMGVNDRFYAKELLDFYYNIKKQQEEGFGKK